MTSNNFPSTLKQLWELTDCDGKDQQGYLFYNIGLVLQPKLENYGYWCTPINSLTFANTGGEGVHFSFLSTEPDNNTPIVMTVPMIGKNIILGENLSEFLALGLKFSYGSLEQLAYSYEETIADIQKNEYDVDSTKGERQLLKSISDKFKLETWVDIKERLKELHEEYFDQIILSENEQTD